MTKEDLVRNVTERSRIHLGRSLCQADVEAVFQALKDVAAQELTAPPRGASSGGGAPGLMSSRRNTYGTATLCPAAHSGRRMGHP